VAKPTAGQDDNQECWHPEADEAGQSQAGLVHDEREWYQSKLWGIDAGMRQDGDENASSGVVEDPRKDDCYGHNHQKENGKVCKETTMNRRQEVRQMPENSQDTQEQGTPEWPIAWLHAGQREAAPPDFLAKRPTQKEDENKVHKIIHHGEEERWKTVKARQRSWLDNDPNQKQRRNAQQAEQIPLPTGAPLSNAAP